MAVVMPYNFVVYGVWVRYNQVNKSVFKATSADYRSMIHTEIHDADEITWGILPYVPMQYED